MISFDIFPEGWDKRCCLDSLDQDTFDTIHFFGNETSPVSVTPSGCPGPGHDQEQGRQNEPPRGSRRAASAPGHHSQA